MKRVGLAIAGLSLVVLLTGCGSEKKLECTTSENQTGVSVNQVYTITFDSKNRFKSAVLSQDMKLDEDQVDYFETYKEQVKTTFENNAQFKDLDIDFSDNSKDTVSVKVSFDADDMSKITGSSTSSADYDDVKSELEKVGYTCK